MYVSLQPLEINLCQHLSKPTNGNACKEDNANQWIHEAVGEFE